MWDNLTKIIAIICVTLFLQTMAVTVPACDERIDRKRAEGQKREEQISRDHWNSFVQPRHDLCVKKGGWPKLFDIPNTDRYDWDIDCIFPGGK